MCGRYIATHPHRERIHLFHFALRPVMHSALTMYISHREPASHSCAPAIPAAPPKNEAARQLLAKNFPSSVAKPALRVKKSANKQVAIMQMRRRAQPADPKDDRPSVNVPISDRLHVEVEVEDGLAGGSRADSPKVFWLRKVRVVLGNHQIHSTAGHFSISLRNTRWLYARSDHRHRPSIGFIGRKDGGQHGERELPASQIPVRVR